MDLRSLAFRRSPRSGLRIPAVVVCAVGVLAPPGFGETWELHPPQDDSGKPVCGPDEELEAVANSLEPGDELVLHGGEYCQTGRRAITVRGTSAQRIVIRAADGETPILTRPDDPAKPQTHNGIEILGEYLRIQGLHFKGGDTGVRILGGSHDLVMEDCEVSYTSNNGVTLNSGDTHHCTFRRIHVHHTGLLDEAYGTTEGEGFYVGGNNASVIAHHHTFEYNHIHDLRATSQGGNDGIEIKYGSYGNTIRHNVIHHTTLGTRYPGILVYGVLDEHVGLPNIVEGNAIWSCGEAIQVVSDAVVQNNLILSSDVGITAAGHAQVPVRRNVSILHNTIAGHSSVGVYMRWAGATRMFLANNAIYGPGGRALDAAGLSDVGVTIRSNYVQGSGVAVDGVQFVDGGSMDAAFVLSGPLDFWPRAGSVLIGSADPAHEVADDFNGAARTAPFDVGAYETEAWSANPGWTVREGVKPALKPLPEPDRVAPAVPGGFRRL